MNRLNRRSGVKKRLLRDLLLLFAATTGSLLAAVFYAGDTLRDDLAVEQLQNLAHKTSQDFAGFFLPVEKALRMAQGWGAAGALDLDDTAALAGRFIPVLENLSKASAIVLGDSEGRSVYLYRNAEGWTSRSVDHQGAALWIDWSPRGQAMAQRQGNSPFDPRHRPWFKNALKTEADNQAVWTRPYLFFTDGVAGVTGSLRFQRPGDEKTYVIGMDVPLQGLLSALSELDVGFGGQAFVTEADGSVLLPPPGNLEDSNELSVSMAPNHFDTGSVFSAVKAWKKAGSPAGQALEFSSNGNWWAWLRPLGKDQSGLWLGISIPETDFLGALRSRWSFVVLAGLLVLAAGLAFTFMLTRHYGRQLKTIPTLSDDPERVEESVMALIHFGESPTLEFKSTMRANLKTGKTGKEIELAWLKGVVGFLNTEGGILLIGVDDEGQIIGIEADNFENDDKCLLHFKNLVNQHIGAEYSKYLQADVRHVAGKTIVAVSCEKAREPVFLMIGKNEEFHIRSGPSSMKLTPRQMLQYLNVR